MQIEPMEFGPNTAVLTPWSCVCGEISCVCVSMCNSVCVRALAGKRLELSRPESIEMQSIADPKYMDAFTLRSKDHRIG